MRGPGRGWRTSRSRAGWRRASARWPGGSAASVPLPGGGGLLDLTDEVLELGDLAVEGVFSGGGEVDPGAAALAGVAFLDLYQAGFLQYRQVLGEVAGGQFQAGAQEPELDPAGFAGDGQDAEADPLVDDVVEAVRRVRHRRCRPAMANAAPASSSTPPAAQSRGTNVHGSATAQPWSRSSPSMS